MKKIFLGLFSLTLLGLLVTPIRDYFKRSPIEELPSKNSLIPKTASKKVQSVQRIVLNKIIPKPHLEKKNIRLIEEALMDYQVNPKDFMKSSQLSKDEAKKFISKTYSNLKECLSEGCGQLPDEETGFYDSANTVAVSTMIRVLEIAEANFEELESNEWLDQSELLDLMDSPSSKLRKLALSSLFKHYPEKSFENTINKLEGLSGYKAGDAVEELIPYLNNENKGSFVEMTKEIISEGDPFTITEVLSKSEEAILDPSQIEDIGSQLCVFKRSKKTEVAFNSMNYSMGNLAKNSGARFNLKEYCR